MPPCIRSGSGATRRIRSCGGFALIITISLLAFLVLLLVVLAALTRVETAIARNTQDYARARQNALVGLNVALGRLQAAAGPDQRVTATADLIGATNSRWTGVWNTTNMAAAPVWLVSGTPPNPAISVSGGIQLVGSNTAGSALANRVTVATENLIVDSYPGLMGNQTIGRYAWWVGDEGVKGRLDIRDTVDDVLMPGTPLPDDPITTAAQRARLRQLFQHRSGGDALPTLALGDEDAVPVPVNRERWKSLANVIAFNQLKFLFAIQFPDATTPEQRATNTAQRNFIRDNFHDFTVYSEGLHANSASGGLRSNLSAPDLLPLASGLLPLASGLADLESFRPNPANTLTVFAGTAPAGFPSAQVKPLITEFSLDIVLYREDKDPFRLLMGYWLRAEFVNPYLLPIVHNPAGSADYLVKIIGLPIVTVTAPHQPVTTVGEVNLGALIDVDLGARIPPTTFIHVDFDANLEPGQIVTRVSGRVQAIDTGRVVTDPPPRPDDERRLNFSAPASTSPHVTVEFYAFYPASNTEILITRFESIPFPAFNRTGTSDWEIASNRPFPDPTTTTHVSNLGMSFHNRADPARTTWGEWINPIVLPFPPFPSVPPDLRAARIPFDAAFWRSNAADPVASANNISAPGISAQFSSADPVFAAGKPLHAFDFTTQRHLSIGGLGMMAFPGARPLSIGSPWGGGLNAAFDSAFFNPVQSNWAPGDLLPNTRHRVISAPYTGATATAANLRGANAAQFLTVAGSFNVNSTSINAWTALLGRTIREWAPAPAPATGPTTKKLENPFFVLGHSAQHGDAAGLGKRTLTDALVQTLAARLSALIRARGAPFASMQEFVNSGVLQQAISDARPDGSDGPASLNASVAGTENIGPIAHARHRPNYLTQAAVLNTLAPVLSARSDTFTIRSFGSVINPVTGTEEGRAWCEAIVQRVPETVVPPPGTTTLMDNATGLGRRFKIVQFRWLTQDDI